MNPATPADAWREAIAQPRVRAAIEAVYADLAREVDVHKPRCDASGRCCHFERWGHRLYVTGLEAAYTLAHAQPRAQGPPTSGKTFRLPQLGDVEAARARGDCPFLDGTTCTAHAARPLGCRVYYCDAASTAWQHDASERLLARLRTLHDEAGVPYHYGEWRATLEMFMPSVR
jgi:Fe-S-cluster containining protein